MRTLVTTTLIGPPFVPQVNPYAVEVGARSARWAAEFGLVTGAEAATRLSRANAADLAGRACPDAEPEQLALLTDLVTWLFAFDDNCDDDGLGADPTRLSPAVARLLDVLDLLGGEAPAWSVTAAGPIGVALYDLCRRGRPPGPPRLLLRVTPPRRDYLLAPVWGAAHTPHRE